MLESFAVDEDLSKCIIANIVNPDEVRTAKKRHPCETSLQKERKQRNFDNLFTKIGETEDFYVFDKPFGFVASHLYLEKCIKTFVPKPDWQTAGSAAQWVVKKFGKMHEEVVTKSTCAEKRPYNAQFGIMNPLMDVLCSGCMPVAKSLAVAEKFTTQPSRLRTTKEYIVMIHGHI